MPSFQQQQQQQQQPPPQQEDPGKDVVVVVDDDNDIQHRDGGSDLMEKEWEPVKAQFSQSLKKYGTLWEGLWAKRQRQKQQQQQQETVPPLSPREYSSCLGASESKNAKNSNSNQGDDDNDTNVNQTTSVTIATMMCKDGDNCNCLPRRSIVPSSLWASPQPSSSSSSSSSASSSASSSMRKRHQRRQLTTSGGARLSDHDRRASVQDILQRAMELTVHDDDDDEKENQQQQQTALNVNSAVFTTTTLESENRHQEDKDENNHDVASFAQDSHLDATATTDEDLEEKEEEEQNDNDDSSLSSSSSSSTGGSTVVHFNDVSFEIPPETVLENKFAGETAQTPQALQSSNGLETTHGPQEKPAPTTIRVPDVIDLVSSSEDEEEQEFSNDEDDDSVHPRKAASRAALPTTSANNKRDTRTRKITSLSSSSSSSSEQEFEWADDISVSNRFAAAAKKENKQQDDMDGLVARTQQNLVLDSSDDEEEDGEHEDGDFESDEDEEDDDLDSVELYRKPTAERRPNKLSFRRNRDRLAQQTFDDFNRRAFRGRLSGCTTVTWSNKLRTTAGLTRLKRSRRMDGSGEYDRSALIELSTKVIDEPSRLRATLLHEMCHAAAWIVDDVSRPPHGTCFQKWAKTATQKVQIQVTTTHDYEIEFKYAWACTAPGCSFVVKRHSRSVDVKKHVCGKCRGKLVPIQQTSADNNNGAATTRNLSAYNAFVKREAPLIRQEWKQCGGVGPVQQQDVLKECARRWRIQKQQQKQKEATIMSME